MAETPNHTFHLKVSEDDPSVAYLHLPEDGVKDKTIAHTLSLHDLIEGYQGQGVYLDLNAAMELVGIEVVGNG